MRPNGPPNLWCIWILMQFDFAHCVPSDGCRRLGLGLAKIISHKLDLSTLLQCSKQDLATALAIGVAHSDICTGDIGTSQHGLWRSQYLRQSLCARADIRLQDVWQCVHSADTIPEAAHTAFADSTRAVNTLGEWCGRGGFILPNPKHGSYHGPCRTLLLMPFLASTRDTLEIEEQTEKKVSARSMSCWNIILNNVSQYIHISLLFIYIYM